MSRLSITTRVLGRSVPLQFVTTESFNPVLHDQIASQLCMRLEVFLRHPYTRSHLLALVHCAARASRTPDGKLLENHDCIDIKAYAPVQKQIGLLRLWDE